MSYTRIDKSYNIMQMPICQQLFFIF